MKIVFLDSITLGRDISLKPIENCGELTLYDNTAAEQVVERIAGFDVVITNKVEIRKEIIDKSPFLKLICVTATGVNNIDVDYAREKGIEVRNVANYSTESVAQVAMMMILNMVGNAAHYDGFVKSGEYSKGGVFTDVAKSFFELKNKVLGIVGMGNIGQRVAGLASAFGMKVQYFSTSGTSHNKDYPSVPFDELLKTSDIVSIHAPLNDKTENLIDYSALSLMKRTAYLVNLGRGAIINEQELVKGLNDGLIAGAAIDVFVKEPFSLDHPYLTELKEPSKIFLSPHIGWASIEARTLLVDMVADNIKGSSKFSPI